MFLIILKLCAKGGGFACLTKYWVNKVTILLTNISRWLSSVSAMERNYFVWLCQFLKLDILSPLNTPNSLVIKSAIISQTNLKGATLVKKIGHHGKNRWKLPLFVPWLQAAAAPAAPVRWSPFWQRPRAGHSPAQPTGKKITQPPNFSQHMKMDWPILTYLGLILSCLKLIQTKPVIYYTNPVMFRTERQTDWPTDKNRKAPTWPANLQHLGG